MALKKQRHAVCDMKYHIVLVTKYRRKVLTGEIAETAKRECTRVIEELLDGKILELETDTDHIHMLIALGPERSIREVMNVLKGVSARTIRERHGGELEHALHGSAFWSNSYYIGTCGGITIETIKQYVASQGKKPVGRPPYSLRKRL